MADVGVGATSLTDVTVPTGQKASDRPVRAVQRRDKWRAGDRQAFLDVLAATGNISQAARSIGRTPNAAHRLRIKDAAFAADWKSAVDAACETIHAAAIAEALRTAGNVDAAGAPCPSCGQTPRPFDQALAFRILNYQAMRDARPKAPPRGNFRPMPMAEVEAALTKRIAAIVRARKSA